MHLNGRVRKLNHCRMFCLWTGWRSDVSDVSPFLSFRYSGSIRTTPSAGRRRRISCLQRVKHQAEGSMDKKPNTWRSVTGDLTNWLHQVYVVHKVPLSQIDGELRGERVRRATAVSCVSPVNVKEKMTHLSIGTGFLKHPEKSKQRSTKQILGSSSEQRNIRMCLLSFCCRLNSAVLFVFVLLWRDAGFWLADRSGCWLSWIINKQFMYITSCSCHNQWHLH